MNHHQTKPNVHPFFPALLHSHKMCCWPLTSNFCQVYRDADKSLARPGRNHTNVSVRMAWISFGALPYRKRNLMTSRFSISLKSRASLTCFRVCFLPGRAKDLLAPGITECCFAPLPFIPSWSAQGKLYLYLYIYLYLYLYIEPILTYISLAAWL